MKDDLLDHDNNPKFVRNIFNQPIEAYTKLFIFIGVFVLFGAVHFFLNYFF